MSDLLTVKDLVWTQSEAIELCSEIENSCPKFGCHVALTGGCLYKEGERKDCDILFYRIRQWDEIDMEGLFASLNCLGIVIQKGFGFCYKGVFKEKNLDLFFPEEQSDGTYPT